MFMQVVVGFVVESCELLLLQFLALKNVVFLSCRGCCWQEGFEQVQGQAKWRIPGRHLTAKSWQKIVKGNFSIENGDGWESVTLKRIELMLF